MTHSPQEFKKLTSRASLLEAYGHTTIRLSSANSYSYAKRDVSFKDYCHEHVKPQKLEILGNGKKIFRYKLISNSLLISLLANM